MKCVGVDCYVGLPYERDGLIGDEDEGIYVKPEFRWEGEEAGLWLC